MSASAPEATEQHSSRSRASRGPSGRVSRGTLALVAIALLGAFLTAVSSFLDILEVTTGQTTLDTQSGFEKHSVAMLLLGAAAVPMALGILRGARPAMVALALIGAVVVLVAFTVDLPDALDEGLFGERYESAEAKPAAGFYVETIGGMLLVLTGGLALMSGAGAGAGTRARDTSSRSPRAPRE
jgi:hypothetical protein